MNQNEQKEMRFVILTQEILESDQLNFAEKIILARITGFETFFESSSVTAEALHTSETIVQRAKRKLVKLGLIKEIGNTGRGKIYQASLWKTQPRYDKNVTSDLTNLSHQTLQKCQTYNIYKIKENIIGDDSVAGPVENSKEEKPTYGREDINELVDLWESETNISIKGQQNQRRQLYNLLRKYGSDATKTLVRRVGVAIRSGDRFAPQIATPSDLTGKYGKLGRLELWEKRKAVSRPFGNHQPTPAPAMATSLLKKKNLPDYGGAFDEQSEAEREKVREMMRKTREKLIK